MVVKMLNAVIANVAVGRSYRPEDQASFTKLKLAHDLPAVLRHTAAVYQIRYSLFLYSDPSVLLVQQVLYILSIEQPWDDSWISRTCGKQQNGCHQLQKHTNRERYELVVTPERRLNC